MIAGERLWRTVDGDIVKDGDPAARFLLVGEGCEVEPDDEDAVEAFLSKRSTKKAEASANKMVTEPAANKSAPADAPVAPAKKAAAKKAPAKKAAAKPAADTKE